MTREQKELLLKDLCARIPYKTKINVDDIGLFIPRLKYIDGITCHFYECAWTKFIDEIKPYLRPMSSMSDEEREEEGKLWDIVTTTRNDLHYLYTDFLVSHHLDYRGLIPMGLALEAPEDMYNDD